jgi:hypothetical protein
VFSVPDSTARKIKIKEKVARLFWMLQRYVLAGHQKAETRR